MMAELIDDLIDDDGFYDIEEIFLKYVSYKIDIELAKERIELRKEIEKAVRENLIIL